METKGDHQTKERYVKNMHAIKKLMKYFQIGGKDFVMNILMQVGNNDIDPMVLSGESNITPYTMLNMLQNIIPKVSHETLEYLSKL